MRLVIDNKQGQYSPLFLRWLMRSLRVWLYASLDRQKVNKITFSLLDDKLTSTEGMQIFATIIDSLELQVENNQITIQVSPKKRYKGIPLTKLNNFIAYGCLGSSKYNLLSTMFNFIDLNIPKIYEVYRRSHGMR